MPTGARHLALGGVNRVGRMCPNGRTCLGAGARIKDRTCWIGWLSVDASRFRWGCMCKDLSERLKSRGAGPNANVCYKRRLYHNEPSWASAEPRQVSRGCPGATNACRPNVRFE